MRGRGRWRGGRGEGPSQIRGFVQPALLLLLQRGPSHGYDLVNGLSSVGFADYPVDSSTVYRTLTALEAEGMVISEMESQGSLGPPRRVYRLTAAGEGLLGNWVEQLRATDRILHRFLQEYDRSR
ncbi:MAG: PadR family transcriptional regulator [Anaerolineae bacterium]|nr:PadR family transcriptional regulator [Anaerolineae bacterium]